jgi:hypothetical protein
MVEVTYLTIIIIGLIAMFFGYGFGLFEGRSQGYKKRKGEEEQEKREKLEPSPTPTTLKVDDPGLMRIKNENGTLTLDLDGTRVNTSSLSSEQRKRLIEMLNFIRPWLEAKPAPVPPSPSLESRLDAVSTPRQNQPDSVPSPASTVAQPSAKKDDKPPAPLSMVGQINQILQARIMNTELADQGLTLIESPTGGVHVYVGMNRYEGVDAVPSEEIKSAIRAAIAEWEKKYTPGLS